ncbi:TPA: 50S ribosomal protein L18 [Candidatus Micrarchaeota archaeon]|nr:50S ribosomal protein L18 [Candidatus Micrarchaeota archaeon]
MARAKGPTYSILFRRRREGKTNYAKRLALVKSGKTRLVVRRSNSGIIVQFVAFESNGDKTLVAVGPIQLKKLAGWSSKRNVYTAYLAGLYAGKEAKKKNITDFVVDFGLALPSKGGILLSALKGVVDAGLSTQIGEGVLEIPKLSAVPDKLKSDFESAKKKLAS